MSAPISKIGFFTQDDQLLFEGSLSPDGHFLLASVLEYDLRQMPSAVAVCDDPVAPYFVVFPAIDSFTSDEPFSKALEGTILGDAPPLDCSVFMIIHGAKKAWSWVEIIRRQK